MILRILMAAVLLGASALASAAGFSGDIGIYSAFVNGIAGKVGEGEPVIQGSLRFTAKNAVYAEGWISQSTQDPGRRLTGTNEFDFTVGRDWKLSQSWSMDVHLMYIDITNPKLFKGTQGDFLSPGATLRFHSSRSTFFYGNAEAFHGIGERGLPGGWKIMLGARTEVGPVIVDGRLVHNQNFLAHGQFVRVRLDTVRPIAHLASVAIRPAALIYHPIGSYPRDRQVVVALIGSF